MSIQAVLFHPGRRLYTLVTAPSEKLTPWTTPETFERLLRAMLMTLPTRVHVLVVGLDLTLNNPCSSSRTEVMTVGTFMAMICGYPGYMERMQRAYQESLDTTPTTVSMARFKYHTAAARATKRIPPYLEVTSFFGGESAVTEFMRALHLPEKIDPKPTMEPSVLEEAADTPPGISIRADEDRKYCGFEVDSRLFGSKQRMYEGLLIASVFSVRWCEGRKPGQTFPEGPSTQYWKWPAFTNIVRNVLSWCQDVSAMKRKFPALPSEPLYGFDQFFKHPRVLAKVKELGLESALTSALEVM